MRKMLRPLVVATAAISVSGCSLFSDNELRSISFPGVHKIDVQQGNVIDEKMINQLRPNMTKRQVLYVMGTPLVQETFDKDRWDYVYSDQPGGKARTQKQVSLFFKDGRLTHFTGDFRPQPDTNMTEATKESSHNQ